MKESISTHFILFIKTRFSSEIIHDVVLLLICKYKIIMKVHNSPLFIQDIQTFQINGWRFTTDSYI